MNDTTFHPSSAPPLGDIAVVLGTHTEAATLAGVITALGSRARVIHTAPLGADDAAGALLQAQGIGEPAVTLSGVAGQLRGLQIAHGIAELTQHFTQHPVQVVIVQGDTDSASIGAQAGTYLGVPVLHIGAGLRSVDRAKPAESNRLIVGALAELHCAATPESAENLRAEGIDPSRIALTGDPVVEVTQRARAQAHRSIDQLLSDGARAEGYLLVAIHRPENTDDALPLERVLNALARTGQRVVFTLHPRTAAAIDRDGLGYYLQGFEVLTGVGHADFLELAANASLIISDSSALQKEVTVLKKPLLVVRRATERPESVSAGFSRLVEPHMSLAAEIQGALADTAGRDALLNTPSPYGDGSASTVIAAHATALADDAAAAAEAGRPSIRAKPMICPVTSARARAAALQQA